MNGPRALVVAACLCCGSRTELDGTAPSADASVVDAPVPVDDFVWWKLDETSGTTAHDSSSHHYDVTLNGVTWNDGAIFDGATCGSVDVAASFRDPPVTITAWIAPASRADQAVNDYGLTPFPPNVVSGDTPGAGGYGVGADVWSAGSVIEVETGVSVSTGFHTIPTPFTPAVASFVALVVPNATNATVYIAGNTLAQESANHPPAVNPSRFHLGCHNDDTGYGSKRFFVGRVRDARIYQRALSAPEIAVLQTAGPAP